MRKLFLILLGCILLSTIKAQKIPPLLMMAATDPTEYETANGLEAVIVQNHVVVSINSVKKSPVEIELFDSNLKEIAQFTGNPLVGNGKYYLPLNDTIKGVVHAWVTNSGITQYVRIKHP